MKQIRSLINNEEIQIKKKGYSKAFGRINFCETKETKRQLIACEAKYLQKEPLFYIRLNHPNLISPLAYDIHLTNRLGLNPSGLVFYFDLLEVTLEDIIYERKVKNSRFQEQEILYACLSILSTLQYLKQHDIEGGIIQTSTIFYDKGQIKMYLNQQNLGRLASYQLILNKFERQPLPSPEILYALKKNDITLVEKYRFETDIFALGLILLEMATLQKSSDLFNIDIQEIDINMLNKRYDQLSQQYSYSLINLIKQMLTMDPTQRPSCENLINQIKSIFMAFSPINGSKLCINSQKFSQSFSLNQNIFDDHLVTRLNASNSRSGPTVLNSKLCIHSQNVPRSFSFNQNIFDDGLVARFNSSSAKNQSTVLQNRIQISPSNSKSIVGDKIKSTSSESRIQQITSANKMVSNINTHQPINQNKQQLKQDQFNGKFLQKENKQQLSFQESVYPSPQIIKQYNQQINPISLKSINPTFQISQTQRLAQSSLLAKNMVHSQQSQLFLQQLGKKEFQVNTRLNQGKQTISLINSSLKPLNYIIKDPINKTSNQFVHNLKTQSQVILVHSRLNQPQVFDYQQQKIQNYISAQTKRNKIKNLIQNHQKENEIRMNLLEQKIQELDEKVSNSIANSAKVLEKQYTHEKQNQVCENE